MTDRHDRLRAARALLIIGAPGAGKTALLGALSTALEIERVPFAAMECDELARGWPYLTLHDVLPRLAAITALQAQTGTALILVVATTENDSELDATANAIAAHRTIVVCLNAPPAVVAGRVAEREPDDWPGKEALIEHARELAVTIPELGRIDAVLDSAKRSPRELASEVLSLIQGSDPA